MDMKKLLEKMTQFAGQAVGQKPGDQVRGTEKAKKGGKDHPFKGRLVGDSVEPQGNMLGELNQEAKDKSLEWELAEAWGQFKEEAFKDTDEKRPSRKGSRPSRGHNPIPRYKEVTEYKVQVDNFTADDIHKLSGIKDLATLKARAFQLVSTPSKRPMKPEKVAWFKQAIDSKTNPESVIKLMWDLLLSGEGHGVIGSRNTMDPNSYRRRFNEGVEGDSPEANAVVAEVIKLIGEGHTEVSPDVITTKVSAALGRPFMLKDLVAANNSSPELQHYIDSINPTKIKFSTDILTVKNEDPMKEKQAAQDGVAKMAARASNRPRLGESLEESLRQGEYHTHTVTFDDGTQGKINVPSDEFSEQQIKDFYAKKGKNVVKVDWDYSVRGDSSSGRDDYDYNRQYAPPGIYENAEELDVGDDVIITGPVQYKGATGVIEGFGKDKRFIIVNLYNYGRQSFHSSDVSFNDYADSEEEEQDWRDRGLGTDDDYDGDDLYEGGVPWAGDQVAVYGTPGQETDHVDLLDINTAAQKYGLNPNDIKNQLKLQDSAIITGTKGQIQVARPMSGVAEGWESGPEERSYYEPDPDEWYDRKRQDQMDIEAEKEQAKRPQKKVYTLTGRGPNYEPNYKFPGEYDSQEAAIAARAKLMADPSTPNPRDIGISTHTRYLDEGITPLRDREDYKAKRQAIQDIQTNPHTANDPELSAEVIRRLAGLKQQASDMGLNIDESRGHEIIARKLADIERQNKPYVADEPSDEELKRREEQAKADYREYVAKMKKKNPNFIPMFKIDEYGADTQSPASATKVASTGTPNTADNAKDVAQATQALKNATQSSAPATNLAKAIDHASQGKAVGQQDMKVLEPLMKDIATVASEPKLSGQFKTLVQQIDQAQKAK